MIKISPDEKTINDVARAIFPVMYPVSDHPLTDFDSEYANRRGTYITVPIPSLADQARNVAAAAIKSIRQQEA